MKPTNVLGWVAVLVCCSAFGADADWAVYGGEAHGTRYSTLTQIDRTNVSKLHALPFAGLATPITYMANGRQYIVIATSDARGFNPKPGAAYVGISLPEPP